MFQTKNFVDFKKNTSIIKYKCIKIQVKNSYLKIKVKYLHYIHYFDRTSVNVCFYLVHYLYVQSSVVPIIDCN